jgi:hypothetical protein
MDVLILWLGCLGAVLVGGYMLLFRKGRRIRGAIIVWSALIAFFVGTSLLADLGAQREGWLSAAEKRMAQEEGFLTPDDWMPRRMEMKAAWEAGKAAGEAEKIAKEKAAADARAAATAKVEAEKATREAEERKAGLHCIIPGVDTHIDFEIAVKKQLNDPDSYEHVRTAVFPVDDAGRHRIIMEFRANNAFGAKVLGYAAGTFATDDCRDVVVEGIE